MARDERAQREPRGVARHLDVEARELLDERARGVAVDDAGHREDGEHVADGARGRAAAVVERRVDEPAVAVRVPGANPGVDEYAEGDLAGQQRAEVRDVGLPVRGDAVGRDVAGELDVDLLRPCVLHEAHGPEAIPESQRSPFGQPSANANSMDS